MNPPETGVVQAFFVLIFALCTSYSAGRLHQWYKHAHERDEAWRSGYDSATRSLFHLATRSRRQEPAAPTPAVGPAVRGIATVGPRHAGPAASLAVAPAARASDENAAAPDLAMLDAG